MGAECQFILSTKPSHFTTAEFILIQVMSCSLLKAKNDELFFCLFSSFFSLNFFPNYSMAFISYFVLDLDFAAARQVSLSDLNVYLWQRRFSYHC